MTPIRIIFSYTYISLFRERYESDIHTFKMSTIPFVTKNVNITSFRLEIVKLWERHIATVSHQLINPMAPYDSDCFWQQQEAPSSLLVHWFFYRSWYRPIQHTSGRGYSRLLGFPDSMFYRRDLSIAIHDEPISFLYFFPHVLPYYDPCTYRLFRCTSDSLIVRGINYFP